MKENAKDSPNRQELSTGIDLLSIASLWFIGLFITNPFGNFPLNDDWSFGLTVKNFLETGDFRPIGWTSMPLLTHTLWGAIFCIPKGFSFEALRFSTLTISLGGILGAYLLIKELNGSRWLAAIVALTIAFNPIYYALSNTFMTDVPFAATMILAVLFLTRSLRRDSDLDLLVGSALIVAATLNRQLGIAIPLAFAVSFILKNGFTSRGIVRALIPSILSIGALLIFEQWLAATDRLPALYSAKSETLIRAVTDPKTLFNFVRNSFIALLYLGWFMLPALAFVSGSICINLKSKTTTRLALLITALAVLVLLSVILWHQSFQLMPLGNNILNAAGIGPFTLRDTIILYAAPHVATLPNNFWLTITVFSLFGGTLLMTGAGIIAIRILPIFWPGKMNRNQAASAFLFLSAAIYMAPLLVHGFFDRYLIAAVPLLAAGILSLSVEKHVQDRRTGEWLFPVVASVLIGFFSSFQSAVHETT